LLLLLFLLLGA